MTQKKEMYIATRKNLNLQNKRAKEKKWKEICNKVNIEVWGLGYKIVTKRLGIKGKPPTEEEEVRTVGQLFPQHPKTKWNIGKVTAIIPSITQEEVIEAANKKKIGITPGGIPVAITVVR